MPGLQICRSGKVHLGDSESRIMHSRKFFWNVIGGAVRVREIATFWLWHGGIRFISGHSVTVR